MMHNPPLPLCPGWLFVDRKMVANKFDGGNSAKEGVYILSEDMVADKSNNTD